METHVTLTLRTYATVHRVAFAERAEKYHQKTIAFSDGSEGPLFEIFACVHYVQNEVIFR